MTDSDDSQIPRGPGPEHFRKSNPVAYGSAQGDAIKTHRLAQIDHRADEVKGRVLDHYQANREPWVAKETIRLWQGEVQRSSRYPSPAGTAKNLSAENLIRKARQNVEARTMARLTRVNDIKTRMQNALVRNDQVQTLTDQFDQTKKLQPVMKRSPRQEQ